MVWGYLLRKQRIVDEIYAHSSELGASSDLEPSILQPTYQNEAAHQLSPH